MHYRALETAKKRAQIVDAASKLFRQRGFSGASVGEIMCASGLTHGPFYNHFASKEALVEESMKSVSERALENIDAVAKMAGGIEQCVQTYLSTAHRDAPEKGCLMAALAPEIAREEDKGGVRSVFTKHLSACIERFERYFPWENQKNARKDSIRMLSSMVGAMVLARAVNDEALSQEILREVRESM